MKKQPFWEKLFTAAPAAAKPRVALPTSEEVAKEKKSAEKTLREKIGAIQNVNMHMTTEMEKLGSENGTILQSNKNLREEYEVCLANYNKVEKEQLQLKTSITQAQIKYNALIGEVNFLRVEREKLLQEVQQRHQTLEALFARYHAIKESYDFIKGETTFSEDLLGYSEQLLDKALKQKDLFAKELQTSEQSFGNIVGDLHQIVRRAAVDFYQHSSPGPAGK